MVGPIFLENRRDHAESRLNKTINLKAVDGDEEQFVLLNNIYNMFIWIAL